MPERAIIGPTAFDFVDAYIEHRDLDKAAEAAGITAIQAKRLLRRNDVSRFLRRRAFLKDSGQELDSKNIIEHQRRIAFSRITDIVTVANGELVIKDSDDWPEDIKSVVQEISQNQTQHGTNIRIKLYSKTPALEFLAKHFGLVDESVSEEKFTLEFQEKPPEAGLN